MTALPSGRIRDRLEDFIVDELPAYEPSGTGTHVFVRLTKRGLTTLDAVRALATACGCDPREAGFAGMKDKRAVATQTLSLLPARGTTPSELADRARSVAIEGIAIESVSLHGNKLKPGHLAGNRFTLVVRDIARERLGEVEAAFARIRAEGVPNAFGSQRFGVAGDNVARGRAWLSGEERPPRDPRVRRLLWSALQSEVFNRVLDARVADGTWATALEGDLLKLRASGGLFVCTAVQTDRERAARGEVSPSGPIIGARMRWPDGEPGALERRIADATLGAGFDLAQTRSIGEGSRRALRMWVEDFRWEIVDDDPGHGPVGVRVYFVLPKGGYATTVLGAAVTLVETAAKKVDPRAAPVGGMDDDVDDDHGAIVHDSTIE